MKKTPEAKSYATEPPFKASLRLNFLVGDVPSLNPHTLPQRRSECLGRCLFEGLIRLAPNGKYQLAGATDFTISDCQTRYVFTLRSLTYSDGTQVTAYDYEAAWKQALHPSYPCDRAHLFYIIKNAENAKKGLVGPDAIGVKALDSHHLQVELNHPAPYFFELLSLPLFAPFKGKGDDLVGSGPYIIASRKRDSLLTLKPNPHFWDASRIALKQIAISMIPNALTAFDLYKKGVLDWTGDPFGPLPEEVLSKEKDWKQKEILQPFWIHLNTQHFPLSSPLIRRALSLAIERDLVSQHIYTGCTPLFTALPKQISCYDSLPHNLAEAKKLFNQGLKELGLTAADFPPLTLSCSSVVRHKRLSEYLKGRWEQVFGIQIHLDVQEWNTFYNGLKTGNYHIGGCFVASEYTDPLALLSNLASPNNFPKWHQPQYQELIEQIKQETLTTKRKAFIYKAEQILEEEMPVISVINLGLTYQHQPHIDNIIFDYSGMPELSWISPKTTP